MTRTVRIALAALGLTALTVALPALLVPRRFFDDFPFLAHWVDRLGTYNQHLIADAGAFHLAFAILFGWAAVRASREAALAACLAWTTFSLPHLTHHMTHLATFPAADAAAQSASLALLTVLPIAVICALRVDRHAPNRRSTSTW